MVESASAGGDWSEALAGIALSEALSAETNFKRSGSYRRFTRIHIATDNDVDISLDVRQSAQPINERAIAQRVFRALAERLCEEHPSISTDIEVLGGTPHIVNTRLSVGKVLAKLYVHGNIQAIVKTYEPHVSEEQVKEAIAYAQDFLEIACDPNEAP
jgi:uncharacterized protein (DUF433 family)